MESTTAIMDVDQSTPASTPASTTVTVPILVPDDEMPSASDAPLATDVQLDTADPTAADVAPSTEAQGEAKAKRASTRTPSRVWDHFKKIPGTVYAKCDYCGKKYSADSKKNGTTTLLNHVKSCKSYAERQRGQRTLSLQNKRLGEESGKLVSTSYSVEACRKALAEFVIKDEQAFRMVQGEGFKTLCHVLEPRFKVPSRMTVYRDILAIYQAEKANLKKYFKDNQQRVCLTTDTWTSIQNLNYMCITVHFIDSDWNLHKKIINFCQIGSHKGLNIGKTLETCLLDWDLERVFTVTLDNASANDKAVDYLMERVNDWNHAIMNAENMQVRCAAHVLNLVVKDGLKKYHDSIARIRAVVKYVSSSPSRLATFKKCAAKEKITCNKGLVLDVKTRWNSTFLMLEAAEKYEKAFGRMEREDKKYKEKFCFPLTSSSTSNAAAIDTDDDYVLVEYETDVSSSDDDSDPESGSRKKANGRKAAGKKPKNPAHAPLSADWSNARSFLRFLKVVLEQLSGKSLKQ